MNEMSDPTMPAALCAVCGHIEAVHYTYIRNGVDTAICKQCDPATELFAGGAVNAEAPPDYSERIDFAEHVFVSVAAAASDCFEENGAPCIRGDDWAKIDALKGV